MLDLIVKYQDSLIKVKMPNAKKLTKTVALQAYSVTENVLLPAQVKHVEHKDDYIVLHGSYTIYLNDDGQLSAKRG